MTPLQLDAARANGAKSHGPVTAEGKAIAARNAVKHGFYARDNVVYRAESELEFNHLKSDYLATFPPTDGLDLDLVSELVAARWVQARLDAVTTETIALAFNISPGSGSFARLTGAVSALLSGASPKLLYLDRLINHTNRRFYNALDALQRHRRTRGQAPPALLEHPTFAQDDASAARLAALRERARANQIDDDDDDQPAALPQAPEVQDKPLDPAESAPATGSNETTSARPGFVPAIDAPTPATSPSNPPESTSPPPENAL